MNYTVMVHLWAEQDDKLQEISYSEKLHFSALENLHCVQLPGRAVISIQERKRLSPSPTAYSQ